MPPPPPPPPPKAPPKPAHVDPAPASGGGASALFAEIRAKGDGITSGLRHVTDDQKVYKQQREVQAVSFDELDRRKAEVEAAKLKKLEAEKAAANVPAAAVEPVFKLEGNKWLVKNQIKASLTIDAPKLNHGIFIAKCVDLTLVVNGKINSVTVVESERVSVQLQSVVSSVDVTSSKKIDVGVTGTLPSAMLDNSSSVNLYLTDAVHSRETQIVTSSCATVNINVPSKDDHTDLVEIPLPEQFVSKLTLTPGGRYKVVTVPSHI